MLGRRWPPEKTIGIANMAKRRAESAQQGKVESGVLSALTSLLASHSIPSGILRSSLATKVEAARQPRAAVGTPARIELLPGRNFEHALEDLARWELIWVIFWFHLNPGWRPKVLPPRSTTGRKGVFATRSPHRPNPIGMSVVRLERVDGLILAHPRRRYARRHAGARPQTVCRLHRCASGRWNRLARGCGTRGHGLRNLPTR